MVNNPRDTLLTIESIKKIIKDSSGMSMVDLRQKDKTAESSTPRHLFCYLAWEYTDLGLKEIAKMVNRDHTTVMSSRTNIRERLDACNDLGSIINKAENSMILIE